MQIDSFCIPYAETNAFSVLVNDYLKDAPSLKPFYRFRPDRQGFDEALRERRQFRTDRTTLLAVLEDQYHGMERTEKLDEHLRLLESEDTFTICTAHQPNLLGGYLYFFYKILHAIRVAEEMKRQYPDINFVPVYYMGSEDNDLEELGCFFYEGKKYVWDAEGQKGAVGRMKTESLRPLLQEFFRHIGPPGPLRDELESLLSRAYLKHDTVAAATRYWINELFGAYGLVVLDPDDARLKRQFISVMRDDLLHHSAGQLVGAASRELAAQYKAQAFVRPVNLFYLREGLRERIERDHSGFQVVRTDIRFTETELLAELEAHPERFSPNVILRGAFQETILPNLSFVGGGAELAYWLQLKPIFEHHGIFYPQLLLRQSVQILSAPEKRLLQQLQLEPRDIFRSTESILAAMVTEKYDTGNLLSAEWDMLQELGRRFTEQATAADITLRETAAAARLRMERQLEHLRVRMRKAYLRREEESRQRLLRLRERTHPSGSLQERHEQFAPYFLIYGFSIFDNIKNAIKPFGNEFLIVEARE